MRIERIQTIRLRVPWGPPELDEIRDWIIVRVHTDDGLVGMARGGDLDIIASELQPLLLGQDARMISHHWQRMYEHVWRFRGPGRAAMESIGAIDVALWDLLGQSCGMPVWRLLGGHRSVVPVYADGIGYVDQDADTVAQLVKTHSDLGYEAVKIHLTTADTEVALEKVRKSREALGPHKKLMVDVWRHWDGWLASEMIRKFQEHDVYLIEEPVRMDDETGFLRMVREQTDCLLAAGEGEGTLYGVRRLITEGRVQVIQSNLFQAGGYTGYLRIAALCNAFHVYVAPHSSQHPEYTCHLAAAVPNLLMMPAQPESEPFQIRTRLYDPPFVIKSSRVEMTERPGVGLSLSEAFIKEYMVA